MPKKRKRDRSNPYRWSMRAGKPQAAPKRVANDTQRAPEPVQVDTARSQSDNISDRGSDAEREAFQVDSTMSQSDPSSSSNSSSSTTPSDRVISGQRETASEQIGEQQAERYPLRHLSVRVPWHDDGWRGTVCKAPHLNGACTKITRIGREKRDEAEVRIAGRSFGSLPQERRPYCIQENSAFMAPFNLNRKQEHTLGRRGGFLPTEQIFPPFTLSVKPFRWLGRERLDSTKRDLRLDLDINREPDLGFPNPWIHDADNLKRTLSGFAAHLRPSVSLCFMYTYSVPFIEGTNRVLVGVGKVVERYGLTEYERSSEGPRGFIMDMPIQHSIRPDPEKSDGFLMPYDQITRLAEEDSSLDIERYAALVSPDHSDEFSYGSELVKNDGAIAALLSMENALERIEQDLSIDTSQQRQWLRNELALLGKLRGPYPGLGAVLIAFGLADGHQVAFELQRQAGENADPWLKADEAFQNPEILPEGLRRDITQMTNVWNSLPDERRRFLTLLSRFELSEDQAKSLYNMGSRRRQGWRKTDAEILDNPYLIYEISREDRDGVPLLTVDRGVLPSETTTDQILPLDGFESPLNPCRIRAFSLMVLEDAAREGHTLLLVDDLVERIRRVPAHRKCAVTSDIINSFEFGMEVVAFDTEKGRALQLLRYHKFGEVVSRSVRGRVQGNRHSSDIVWKDLLEEEFGTAQDDEEVRAHQEKALALAELAESRFSVLAGSAGTGKTSLLGILCSQDEIRQDGKILLLAPTGKARVRMQELAEGTGGAKTVAQFLIGSNRFNPHSFKYQLSDSPKVTYGTVIVDEASMLTEDMLGALLDALKDVKRFILVGDPSQLPPIGAGRPFVDIVTELRPEDCETRFPRVAKGYAELTVERRQVAGSDAAKQLARWFSATSSAPSDDSIFSTDGEETASLRFVQWDKPEDFKGKFLEVMAEELKLADTEDRNGFHRLAMGSTPREGDFDLFSPTENGNPGAVQKVEEWQVLSPLRGMPFGIGDINRHIHNQFHGDFVSLASEGYWERQVPKPFGAEQIVYGDKVINLRNDRLQDVYPVVGAQQYIANGEIGIVVGQLKAEDAPPNTIQIEFSSQQGYIYDFDANGEQVPLELAYALTVHKAQGSQFDLVILVLPKEHRIMSRELIYTALTRHRRRVVVMHQGSLVHLKELTEPHRSEIARRRTNLFGACKMSEVRRERGSVFLEERLIHRTGNGLAVRSKSELLIAEVLENKNVPFRYEQPLQRGGKTYFPDFTISDENTGRTVYWEHLGMLDDESYERKWNKKLSWYRSNGILPYEENRNGDAVLVTTQDSPQSGLDMAEVRRLIQEVYGG